MATKLSDLLKEKGLTLDDLIDDELNLPVSDVRKKLRDNQSAYTQETQRRAEVERQLQQAQEAAQTHHGNAQQLQQYANQLQARLQEIQNQAQQVQAAGRAGLPAWRQDSLYQPLIEEFDSIRGELQKATQLRDQELRRSQEVNQALARGIITLSQNFETARQQVDNQFRQLHIQRMKQTYTDFDNEKVEEYAKKHGIGDWDSAYKGWRGEQMPDLIEKARKEAREEALREVQGRTATPVTEMGSGGAPAPPVPEPKRDYESAWKGLEKEFQELGIGGNG